MIESESPRLDALFHALSDPTRRAMLGDLAQGARTVTDLARPHAMSLAAASRHVRVLEDAGLLRRQIQWRTHTCHLNAEALLAAHAWIDRYRAFWTGRLDRLEALLQQEDTPPPQPPKGTEP